MVENTFGKTLKQLRIEQCMSQRELGEKLEVCNQTVSFWENGQREPDLDMLVKISNFFDVSIDFLLGKSDC